MLVLVPALNVMCWARYDRHWCAFAWVFPASEVISQEVA